MIAMIDYGKEPSNQIARIAMEQSGSVRFRTAHSKVDGFTEAKL